MPDHPKLGPDSYTVCDRCSKFIAAREKCENCTIVDTYIKGRIPTPAEIVTEVITDWEPLSDKQKAILDKATKDYEQKARMSLLMKMRIM